MSALTLEVVAKFVAYVALIGCAGTATVLAMLPGTATPGDGSLSDRARRLAIGASLAGFVALGLRAVAHAAIVAGEPGAPSMDMLRVVAVESRWGQAWRWQVLAAALAAVAAWRAHAARGAIPLLCTVAAWCVVTPWMGHGAASTWQRSAHALHLAVTGAWIGTVMALAAVLGTRVPADRVTAVAAIVARFSPRALTCAALVAVSGTVLGLVYAGDIWSIPATPYGRLLVAKVAAVAAVGACGFGNWQRVRAGRSPSAPLIRLEAALAVMVLALTTVLTETEHPE